MKQSGGVPEDELQIGHLVGKGGRFIFKSEICSVFRPLIFYSWDHLLNMDPTMAIIILIGTRHGCYSGINGL